MNNNIDIENQIKKTFLIIKVTFFDSWMFCSKKKKMYIYTHIYIYKILLFIKGNDVLIITYIVLIKYNATDNLVVFIDFPDAMYVQGV